MVGEQVELKVRKRGISSNQVQEPKQRISVLEQFNLSRIKQSAIKRLRKVYGGIKG